MHSGIKHRFFWRGQFITSAFCIIVIALAGCNGGFGKPGNSQAEQLIGAWENTEFPQNPTLTFNKDETYLLNFPRGDAKYNGNYHISGNMIHVLDFYCGTGVPGIYRFEIKGNELAFSIANDPNCDRNKFFPQKWVRKKQ